MSPTTRVFASAPLVGRGSVLRCSGAEGIRGSHVSTPTRGGAAALAERGGLTVAAATQQLVFGVGPSAGAARPQPPPAHQHQQHRLRWGSSLLSGPRRPTSPAVNTDQVAPHARRPGSTDDEERPTTRVQPAAHRAGAGGAPSTAEGNSRPFGPGHLVAETTRPVSAYCIAEGFELKHLAAALSSEPWAGPVGVVDSDVVHVPFRSGAEGGEVTGELFLFDYGVMIAWGLDGAQETMVLESAGLNRCVLRPLPRKLLEKDTFECGFADGLAPANAKSGLSNVQNGVITLDARFRSEPLAKLAVSHAIAQSTKLSVFEQRVTSLAAATQHIPHELAARGAVAKLTLKDASRLTGQLFLQKSAVNLLSTVLDVPEFFWDAADELQGLYGTVTKYLELKNRVAVLNARYEVLESMLLMVQQQLNNDHGSRLEWIIIWLIVIEVFLGIAELVIIHGATFASSGGGGA